MKRGFKVLAAVLVVAVAFACGWVVSQVQTADRVPVRKMWTDNWIVAVGKLAGGAQLLTPERTQSFVADDLYSDSLALSELYDSLSKYQRAKLQFWIPQARLIAAKQYPGTMEDPHYLSAFIDCMQSVKAHGGLVSACMKEHGVAPTSH